MHDRSALDPTDAAIEIFRQRAAAARFVLDLVGATAR